MGGFLFYVTGFCNSNHRSLRRTLVRLARYSTSFLLFPCHPELVEGLFSYFISLIGTKSR